MIKYLKKGVILGVLGIFLLVVVCQMGPAFAEKPKRGGRLTVATDATPVGLDPHLSLAGSTLIFAEHVYETLLRYNYNMAIEPCLATSWEQLDDVTYVFHLRKGVKFHNGREMTSEDVKFTFDRIVDPKTGAVGGTTFKKIKSVEALDRYTVKFTLKDTMPAFLYVCAYGKYSMIVPKDEVLKRGSMQKHMVGTGPFKLKEYKHGVGATYVRNEDYWEPGIPYLDGFKMVVVKDEGSRLAGVRTGVYDIGWVKGLLLAKQAGKEPNLRIEYSAPARLAHMFMNPRLFPFSNVKLRQAVSACLDRQAIINKVMLGQGKLATIFAPSAVDVSLSQQEIANLPFYKQDYELAKKLLKEAGYPNGFEFTIKTSPHSPDYVPSSEIIAEQLSKVGIKAKIMQMEWGAFQKIRRSLDFQANYYASSWRPDPTGYFDKYFHSESKSNETGVADPEIDRLIDLCSTEANFEKRKKHFRELQYKAAEKAITISTYGCPSRYEIVNDKVKGYRFLGNKSRRYLREAWISK